MSKQLPTFNALIEIIHLDFCLAKQWFRKNTASKVVVIFAYLSVLLLVGLGIFFWSNTFFKYLIGFEKYGIFTSEYILKGAFAILIWIGILSSLMSTATSLLTTNRHTDYLLTLPISDMAVSLTLTLKSLITNTFLFLVSIFPLILAFVFSQSTVGNSPNLTGLFLALIVLVFLTESIGSSFAYLLIYLTKKKYGIFTSSLSVLILISATWLVIKMVFPPELKMLDIIATENFDQFFKQLPLNSRCLLGNSFVTLSTGGILQSSWLLLVAVVIFGLSLILQKKLFLPCRQSVRINVRTAPTTVPFLSLSKIDLVAKDILSIFRSTRNLSYGLFLIIMIITFFGLFSRGYLVGTISEKFRVDAISFSFAWLIFFSGTFLLRFVYPLMVNEGKSRWWFFTIPTSTSNAIGAKIIASLVISLPLYVLAIVEWYLMPFAVQPLFLVILSILAIVFLAVAVPLMGVIRPDYYLAFDADRASTSFTGIITLLIIVGTGFLGSLLIQMSIKQNLRFDIALNSFLAVIIIAILTLWFFSTKITEGYKLDT